jgi:hypothetical protein
MQRGRRSEFGGSAGMLPALLDSVLARNTLVQLPNFPNETGLSFAIFKRAEVMNV